MWDTGINLATSGQIGFVWVRSTAQSSALEALAKTANQELGRSRQRMSLCTQILMSLPQGVLNPKA
jgi:hypothetical protein